LFTITSDTLEKTLSVSANAAEKPALVSSAEVALAARFEASAASLALVSAMVTRERARAKEFLVDYMCACACPNPRVDVTDDKRGCD
jgi:hypothetical protein